MTQSVGSVLGAQGEYKKLWKNCGKSKKLPGLAHLFVSLFPCPLLFYLWHSPAIKSYPSSNYWLHLNNLGSSISWGWISFLKVLLLRLLKHWEVTEKQEIKKTKTKNWSGYTQPQVKHKSFELLSCSSAVSQLPASGRVVVFHTYLLYKCQL